MFQAQLRDSGIRLDTSDSSSDSSSSLPVTTLERLIRSHPIWFLPRVDRLEAAQILQSGRHPGEPLREVAAQHQLSPGLLSVTGKLGVQEV